MLDVGCGWGGAADRLSTIHGAAAVVGLTPSPGAGRAGRVPRRSGRHHPRGALVRPRARRAVRRHRLHRGVRALRPRRARRRREGGGLPRLLRARRRMAPARRAVGAAGHLPRQRRPPGEPVRRRRDQRPDPLGDLPGVDVLVALGAGPRLGDRLPLGVLPRRAGALRPHLPGLELGAPRGRRSSRRAGRPRGPPALRPLLRRQPRAVPAPAADPVPDRPVAPARAEALGRRLRRPVREARGRRRRRRPTRRPGRGRRRPPIRGHYDLSNEFYALWLGPSMSYSSGRWTERHP